MIVSEKIGKGCLGRKSIKKRSKMSLAIAQECKRAVSSLSNLTNDELDKIMNDDEKIENILTGSDQVSDSYL